MYVCVFCPGTTGLSRPIYNVDDVISFITMYMCLYIACIVHVHVYHVHIRMLPYSEPDY